MGPGLSKTGGGTFRHVNIRSVSSYFYRFPAVMMPV